MGVELPNINSGRSRHEAVKHPEEEVEERFRRRTLARQPFIGGAEDSGEGIGECRIVRRAEGDELSEGEFRRPILIPPP